MRCIGLICVYEHLKWGCVDMGTWKGGTCILGRIGMVGCTAQYGGNGKVGNIEVISIGQLANSGKVCHPLMDDSGSQSGLRENVEVLFLSTSSEMKASLRLRE